MPSSGLKPTFELTKEHGPQPGSSSGAGGEPVLSCLTFKFRAYIRIAAICEACDPA